MKESGKWYYFIKNLPTAGWQLGDFLAHSYERFGKGDEHKISVYNFFVLRLAVQAAAKEKLLSAKNATPQSGIFAAIDPAFYFLLGYGFLMFVLPSR